MNEIYTRGIVLDRKDYGEIDSRITLYTQELGKITPRAKSARKINSRLSAHLEPLTFGKFRIIEKNGFQIVDALAEKNFKLEFNQDNLKIKKIISIFSLISELVDYQQPEPDLWNLLASNQIFGSKILKVLGFDPTHATCINCAKPKPKIFIIKDMHYICQNCFKSRAPNQSNYTTK
jgi:DNA repair protein RecO (recombination protein O)